MGKNKTKNSAGFTLIETLVYIALFAILLGSAFVTAYKLIEGGDWLNRKTVIQEETNFVIRKIHHVLNGLASINSPSVILPYSDNLSITKYDGTQVDIRRNGSKIEIRNGSGGVFLPITTDNVEVTSLQFYYLATSGGAPAGVQASTTISGFTSTTTKYIRK